MILKFFFCSSWQPDALWFLRMILCSWLNCSYDKQKFSLNCSSLLVHNVLHTLFHFFSSLSSGSSSEYLTLILNNSFQMFIAVKSSYQIHFVPTKWTWLLNCFILPCRYSPQFDNERCCSWLPSHSRYLTSMGHFQHTK